jgi:protoporphyrinogen oxidase
MQKVIILGAGPAGLSAGYALAREGYKVTLIEKEAQVGGISKTVEEKGYRFDLGGHRFFTKIEEVEDLWNEVLGEEFLLRPRLSRIYYRNKFFDYPIKPFNALAGLGLYEAILILASYMKVTINPIKPEESFEDWVSNRFGRRLYEHFFKSYTEKVWGISCTELKAEWAAQRIKGLSLVSAVVNALLKQFRKNQIKTLIEEFNYPRLGPGQMYEAIADVVKASGGQVWLNTKVTGIDIKDNRIAAVTVLNHKGGKSEVESDHVISSLALRDFISMVHPVPQQPVLEAGNLLKYRDFLSVNIALNSDFLFPDNWIYVHSPEVKLGRIQNFKRWSPSMVPEEGCSSLGLEYFCNEGDELWSSPDEDLIEQAVEEISHIGLAKRDWVKWGFVIRVPKAYPVYDDDYQKSMPVLMDYIGGLENFQSIGRNGLHRYNNMDHSILTGLLAAKNIQGSNYDLWEVNTEEEYHEEDNR